MIAALAVFFAARYDLVQGLLHTALRPVSPGVCRAIGGGIHGPEDFAIDAPHNAIFVSSINRQTASANSDPHDGLYLLKLNDPAAPPVKLAGTPLDFHPHGISLYRAADGSETLMAIDRQAQRPAHDRDLWPQL